MTWNSPPIGEACLRIIEEWLVIDRWWTETPVHRHYQKIADRGRVFVRMSEDEGEWQEMPGLD